MTNPHPMCPGCGVPLALTGRPHCAGDGGCSWVRCRCGTTVDRATGRHYPLPMPATKPEEAE